MYGWFKLKGERSEEGAIVRVMVRRGEAEMGEIEKQLRKKYGVELRAMIREIVPAGNERDLLLAMATTNNSPC